MNGLKTVLLAGSVCVFSATIAAESGLAAPLEASLVPRIDSLAPDRGLASAATEVIVLGANLMDANITANGLAVTPLSRTNTEIRISIPSGDNGYVTLAAKSAHGEAYSEFVRNPPDLNTIGPGDITTVAGVGLFSGEGRLATRAMIEPTDMALAPNGDIFLAEPGLAEIRRIRTDGIITTFAGDGQEGFSGDGGPALEARLWQPRSIVLDASGNLYVVDIWTSRVRRVDAISGVITTIAGTGVAGFSGDGGPATQAKLHYPVQLAIDSAGNLYILECGNSRVRKINPAGTITTIAGNGTPGFSGDGGPATAAQINIGNGVFIDEGGIAVDSAGNVYIADSNNQRIRRIDHATGLIDTVADAAGVRAVTTDAQGNIYYATNKLGGSQPLPRIVKLGPQLQTLGTWGLGHGVAREGTPAAAAAYGYIDRVRIDPLGNILFTDFTTRQLWRINLTSGLLEAVAGIGLRSIGETGAATEAILKNYNSDIAFDSQGKLLFADGELNRIRAITADGRISTVAGSGVFGLIDTDDVPAVDAQIYGPIGIDATRDGSLLITNSHAIRKIDGSGVLRLVAGNQFRDAGMSGDGGPAIGARFNQPWDMASDTEGNMYIADTNNNRIRRVDAVTGVVTTVAGSGKTNAWEAYGTGTSCGDGGLAVNACINTPYGVALDAEGNLFISENWQRIRKIDKSGIITTHATVYATKMTLDAAGNIFAVAGQRVVRVSPQGTVSTIAGTGQNGFSGDGGAALNAKMTALGQASGIAISPSGDLFFSDGGNRRIRAVKAGAWLAPGGSTLTAQAPVLTQASVTTVNVTLSALLTDSVGDPAGGVQITFTAPAVGSGCSFGGKTTASVLTDRNGRAFTSCIATIDAPSFQVTASALGLPSAQQGFQVGRSGETLASVTTPANSVPQSISGSAFRGPSDPVAGSSAAFAIGLTRDNGSTYTSTAPVGQNVKIQGFITPEAQHLGMLADIFIVDRVNLGFMMKNQDGNFIPWTTGRIVDLVPFREDVLLTWSLAVDIFTGKVGVPGDHRIFLGYMTADGTLRYTPVPLRLTISDMH